MRYLLAMVAVLALAAGCTTTSRSTESDAAGPGRAAVQPAQPQAKPNAGAPGALAAPGATAAVPIPGQDRQLARTAQLTTTVPDVRAAADQARQIAVAAGGYSGSEHTDSRSASLSLLVPSDKLDNTLTQLSALGQVTSSQQTAQDVTDQVVDVESRLESARRSVDRLRALLDRATSISDIASIESQLATRESDLESLESRQKALAGQVAMSTVSLTVTAAPPLAAEEPESGFLAGLAAGWHGFLAFGRGFLNVLGAVLPFAAILGVPLAALVFWLARRRSRPTPKPETPTAA
ncbi:DUF4349 domain-containing protein [Amycolatopsis taiwanensis]|uniref:DUF4349 domain-containing protein n=1 Tax=Amycolatopsis taiwanensis TaxID=342230 RepID=UPI0004BBFE0F|nr:DUF4349 domain-containing protein [Amycolatopsis taiwanensis]